MTSDLTIHEQASLAMTVAPEDVRCGDYVAILNEIVEFPSFLWCDPVPGASQEIVRVRFCAPQGGIPLKVKGICLPFVFVTTPLGMPQTLDVRQIQLVRLPRVYAKTVWKALREFRSRARLDETMA